MQRDPRLVQFGSVRFGSVQGGIYALGKAHVRSTPSLRSSPNIAFETIPMFVSLTMAFSRPFKEDRLALPLSTPLSSRWDVLGFVPAGSVSSFSTLPHLEHIQLASMHSTQHPPLSSITVELALRVGSLVLLSSQPLF